MAASPAYPEAMSYRQERTLLFLLNEECSSPGRGGRVTCIACSETRIVSIGEHSEPCKVFIRACKLQLHHSCNSKATPQTARK